jgi:hypothetical protein
MIDSVSFTSQCIQFSRYIVEIQSKLSEVVIGDSDMPTWNTRSGSYSCAATWDALRTRQPEVPWHKVVWFSMAIPCHSFMLCLVFRNALVTKDRMCLWGYSGNTLCRFCFGRQESIEHLFFQFEFSRRIWSNLMESCLVSDPFVERNDVAKWSMEVLQGKSLQTNICKLCFPATVYHVWKHINDLCHGTTPRSEESIELQIR